MKGFFIDVVNDLLDPKHKQQMGIAVWEFMWLLDKITRIDEDGTGWVLGGKPINIRDICAELGGGDRATRENLNHLEKEGYIRKQRTPGGLRIWVAKAKKRFGRSVRQTSAAASAANRRSNIRQDSDINKRMPTSATSAPLEGKKRMDINYNIDEDGNEVTHDSWGRPLRKGPKDQKEGKNKIALRLQHKFVELAQKHLGTSPVMDIKGYKMCLYAMNTGGLTEVQIKDLFDEWFKLGKSDEDTISITRALSARQIEAYKVRNGVK